MIAIQQPARFIAGAVLALGAIAAVPALAQTTAVPGSGTPAKSSPGARDAQGHAADPTMPMANPKGNKPAISSTSGDVGAKPTEPRTAGTPMNTTPGAGLRNSGTATPPTSGAAGR